MFVRDNPICRARALESPQGLEQNYALVSGSIRKQTSLLCDVMDDYRANGLLGAKEFQWGNKKKGAKYVTTHLQEWYDGTMKIIKSKKKGSELDMILHWLQVPGLGLPKAGFMVQLTMGRAGCMDVHNLRKYLPDEDASKGTPSRWQTSGQSAETKRRKAIDYLDTCKKVGGCKFLWDTWCTERAEEYPDHFEDGDHVSKLHPIWVS